MIIRFGVGGKVAPFGACLRAGEKKERKGKKATTFGHSGVWPWRACLPREFLRSKTPIGEKKKKMQPAAAEKRKDLLTEILVRQRLAHCRAGKRKTRSSTSPDTSPIGSQPIGKDRNKIVKTDIQRPHHAAWAAQKPQPMGTWAAGPLGNNTHGVA